jgi:hypothetical protein
MAFIDISPNIPFVNIFSSDYPTGVSFSVVESALIANNIITKTFDITNVSIGVTPTSGFANGEFTGKTYMVFVQAYELDGEVVTPAPNEDAYFITVYYVNSNPQVDDTTPPVITPKGSTDITIVTNQFSSSTTFINTYFNVTDPQSGVSSISLNPNIDWASVRARGSVNVVAVNGDGYQSTYSFFLTIVLSPEQTPPTISGPSSITVYTDENMNNTKFIETKGFTITTATGLQTITFNPSINWTTPATTTTTITVIGNNGLTASLSCTITVAVRPPVDTEAPQVTQGNSIVQFLKSAYPTSVPSATITTSIRNSFIVSDANDFEMIVAPTVTDFTTVGERTYNVKFVDEFLNESPTFTIQVRYNDDTDLVAPTITGPSSVSFVAGQNKTQIDVIANYTLSDNVDINPQWFNLTPTTFNTVGTYSYLLRAIDSSGNIGQRTITVNVVADSVENDVIPPIVNGPTSFRFREADEITVADLIPYYTVTDNVSARANINYIATLGGSTLLSTYQFNLGITFIVLRFYDEAENYSLPLTVKVEIIDDDVVLDYEENPTLLNNLTANHQYSAPMVSIIDDGEWKPISWLVDPVQVNYTIDGLSDEININFISRNLDTALPSGEIVRVVYDSKSTNRLTWGLPEYDSLGRPTNHDIMIVESGSMVKNGSQNFYRHNYKLVELINILKDYRLPTLTFTSFEVSKITDAATGNLATYYARPYNALSILQRVLKQAFPNTTLEQSDLPTLIRINDANGLANEMIGVDHQFEEATLYDAITEIGRIIGKVPVLYLNPNFGVDDEAKYILFFEKDNEHTKDTVSKTSLLARSTEFIETTLPNKGAGQIVVDGHNIIGSKVSTYPSDDMYGFAVAVDETALDATDSKIKIVLPYNISSAEVVRFKKYVTRTNIGTTTHQSGYPDIDSGEIPIVKYNEWLVLDADKRLNTAYYKENTNEVFFDIGGGDYADYFTTASYSFRTVTGAENFDEYKYILFQVDYFPLIDLQARVGSGKQTTFNQVNPMVDSETLGDQVVNYLKGNEDNDISVSKVVYSYEDILKPTQLVDWDGELYTVTSVSFNSGKSKNGTPRVMYKVAYQLNKQVRRNFNLTAPSNQREYQINYENTFDRFNVIKDNIKLHLTTDVRASNAAIYSDVKYLRALPDGVNYRYVMGSLETGNTYPTVESVAFSTQSTVFTNSSFTTFETQFKYLMAHPVKTVFGNSLLINFKLYNNVFAGTRIFNFGSDLESVPNFDQRQVNYTDPFGKVQRTEINFVDLDFDLFGDIKVQTEQYPLIENSTKYAEISSNAKTLVRITGYDIDKDTRENFNVTYQVEFDGINGTQVGSEIVKYSGLYQKSNADESKLRLVKLKNKTYKPDDRITVSDLVGITLPITSITPYYSNGLQIIFDDDYVLDTISNYALVEVTGTDGIFFTYKILAIMGDRSSLVETDRVFLYY